MLRVRTLAAVLWANVRLPWLGAIPDPIEAQQWIDLWVDYPHLKDDVRNKLKSRAYGLMYGMRDLTQVVPADMILN